MSDLREPASQRGECYHCGTPVPENAPWKIRLEDDDHPLCCPGCEAVAHAIIDGGLASYYRFRTQLPERPEDLGAARADTWTIFDDPDLQREFVHQQDGDNVVTLAVEGITCAACAWLIEHRLNAMDGVASSAVNLTHHRVRVAWNPQRLALSRILAELAAIGYPAQPYEPDQVQARLEHDERMAIRRLIVAAVAMMQVMMFSIPMYMSEPGEISPDFIALFHWLSFALATPVVFFSALPFFRNAWRDLKTRMLGMDVPVSLAIGGAYLASGYAVISGQGETYFDSVSMFAFFLLFGRYIEMRARRRNGQSGNALIKALPMSALRLEEDGRERAVPSNRLTPEDRILVKPGHSVPADGIIEEGRSSLDEAMLTGEPAPVPRGPGERVTGGSHNVESPLIVRVTQAGAQSRAAGILDLSDRAFSSRPRIADLASRTAHYFVIALLLISAVVAAVWSQIDPSRVLWVTLSLLVVTCPCALALATPTALTAGHGQLRRRGVLITRAHAIEILAQLDRVIFDKTGTLTQGRMTLDTTHALEGLSADRARSLAAALEAHSEHPIARAFHPYRQPQFKASQVLSRPGKGLEGYLDGQRWRLGKPDFAASARSVAPPDDGTWLLLAEEGAPRAWFSLRDALRDDADRTVGALKALGLEVELLSGDDEAKVAALARELGIEHWQAGASPEDKLERIKTLQTAGEKVAMVGDGINDVPVLAGADVAIAMNGATDLARTSADAVLLSPHLFRIAEAIELSRATRRIIRQNLVWALCYNLIALPLAACGLIPPWVAALGMSASSLIVVGNALRLGGGKTTRAVYPSVSPSVEPA